jgi:hypothetical protein
MAETVAPAAPAAAPTPAAAPPTNAAPVPQSAVDEDSQIIEDLRREHFAKEGEKDDAADAAEPETPVKAAEKPAKDRKPYNAEGTKYKTPEAAVSAITAALESGDVKALCKAIGKPANFLEASGQKWAAFRERTNAVAAREKALTTRETAFNAKLTEARQEVGVALKAKQAYRDGKFGEFVTLVAELAGESYDEAQRKVITGELAMTPDVKKLRDELATERAERRKEAAERAAKEEQQTNAQKQQEAYRAAVDAVTEELAGHRVSKVRNFQRQVLDRVRESFDPNERTYTMSFADAADAIMADKDAEADALGYAKPAPAPAARTAQPRAVPRGQTADARPTEREPWEERELSDDEIIASIKRDVRTGRIKVT